jgi:hypothetical protein
MLEVPVVMHHMMREFVITRNKLKKFIDEYLQSKKGEQGSVEIKMRS